MVKQELAQVHSRHGNEATGSEDNGREPFCCEDGAPLSQQFKCLQDTLQHLPPNKSFLTNVHFYCSDKMPWPKAT